MKRDIRLAADVDDLSRLAAGEVVRLARAAVDARGRFTLVLSGGATPRGLYALLAQEPLKSAFPWRASHFFFGDERCVPRDHAASNFAMARKAMLRHAPVPPENVHAIPAGEAPSPGEAAEIYERALRIFFRMPRDADRQQGAFPVFDLVLLGIGRDGHTASLFPGHEEILEGARCWAAAVHAPAADPPGHRVTLTLPVFNRARMVFFLVSGRDKREVVGTVLERQDEARALYPAARVRPEGGLVWFIDRDAWPGCC